LISLCAAVRRGFRVKRFLSFVLIATALLVWPERGGAWAMRPDKLVPDLSVVNPDPAFPLRVRLFSARWGGLGDRNHGYGTGNFLGGDHAQGFDYAFQCSAPFVPNEETNGSYQARWKGSHYQLEILTGDAKGKHQHKCTLNLALESRPFTAANFVILRHGVSSSLRTPWRDPGFAYEGPAPEYPVQFHVLDTQRKEDDFGDHGSGTANLSDPSAGVLLEGGEFQYDCGRGFLVNTQLTNYYPGKWVKLGAELEILMQRPGSDQVDKCKVRVQIQPDAYPERPLKGRPADDADESERESR
jgi:hypothetical protein